MSDDKRIPFLQALALLFTALEAVPREANAQEVAVTFCVKQLVMWMEAKGYFKPDDESTEGMTEQ